MTRVLVVDDHPVFRRGLATLLDAEGFEVVAEAAGAAEAVACAGRHRPDLVLLDLGLPDGSGLDALTPIVALDPAVRVVVVTMHDDTGSVRAALRAGAAGYVVKDASPAEIVGAVRAALTGAVVLGSGVAAEVSAVPFAPRTADDPFGLTPRERQVLDLVARGLANRQIAERLGLAGKTVSNLVSSVLAKLGATDRAEAARIARERFGG